MPEILQNQWFKNWFNSPYYHILYKDRNDQEAELFIDNIIAFLKPDKNARFLDLGCGKGRHSIYLHKKGFNVVGVDLSSESIEFASKSIPQDIIKNTSSLEFYVQDMRKPGRINYYNYILNLFTSFGYFENEQDDYATINSVSKGLQPNGIFVIDFMNAQKVIANLIPEEIKTCDGITFKISRSVIDHFIVKNILFTDQGKEHHFQEQVKALTILDFEKYFAANKLKILHLFGNYKLEDFNPVTSDRLIIIGQKAP